MLTRDRTQFYLPPTRLSTNEMSHPAFDPQPQRITALWPVLISRSTEGRRLIWPGWLVTYLDGRMDAEFLTRLRMQHQPTKNEYEKKLRNKYVLTECGSPTCTARLTERCLQFSSAPLSLANEAQ